MVILTEEEEKRHVEIADTIAGIVYTSAVDALEEMHATEVTEDISLAISLATGQVAYDKVIELTEGMSREDILKFYTHILGMYGMQNMMNNPMYSMKVIAKSYINKKDKP